MGSCHENTGRYAFNNMNIPNTTVINPIAGCSFFIGRYFTVYTAKGTESKDPINKEIIRNQKSLEKARLPAVK